MLDIVSFKDVGKSYVRGSESLDVLKSINLRIKKGEFVALMGPSGSGKSTILNLLAGLDRPNSGEISVADQRLDAMTLTALARWRARHIGFVFQFYNLFEELSAEGNVDVPLLLSTLPKKERQRRVATALDLVGMRERSRHRPSELSGGQQQRVAIARAIIGDPTILVCDEPTGDLDRGTADEILGLLSALNRTQGKTIVMVTHDAAAAVFASREVKLDKGRLIGAGQEEPQRRVESAV